MDEGGRDNRRHRIDYYKVPQWNVMPQYQTKEPNAFQMNAKLAMLFEERDAAVRERDRALAEKKSALDERDAAIKQLDTAVMERDDAIRERDNAIAALQFQESTMNAILSSGTRGSKHSKQPRNHHPNNIISTMKEECISNALIPYEAPTSKKGTKTKSSNKDATRSTKSSKKMKIGEDLNRQVTTDGSKAEWDAQDLGSMNQIIFDESSMPVPVCSCTGVPRQCYKWGNGGWQSACCTTSLSMYPLPQMPNKRHARMGGRKMSGSVFSRLLTRLAATGHDSSVPVDLKDYWAKHGTNRYITIK